jgi:hypothetical protein
MDRLEKACIDLAPKVSQAGSTIRMFADGGGPGVRIQSELSVLNANGALVGHTSSGPNGTLRDDRDKNNTPARSGPNIPRELNSDLGSAPAAGFGDTLSPILRVLQNYKRSAFPDGPALTSEGAPPATPAPQPDMAERGAVRILGKFVGNNMITPAAAASPSRPPLPGPTAPNLPSRESAFGDQSENAPAAPSPDTYPRLRRVSSAFPDITPRNPDQPAPKPEPGPLLGIFSGKPMSLSPFPLPLGGLPDNSDGFGSSDWFNLLAGIAPRNPAQPAPPQQAGASQPVPYLGRRIVDQLQTSASEASAPAAPFAPSDGANLSGGLLGRLAALAGIDPQNPAQPVPPPLDGQLRGFYRDDPVQPWFVQRQR